jgi:1-acyl-sn-glycerol-3-phosphate acyltransferase
MADPQLVDLKPQVYIDPRPAEYFQPFHERARSREPDMVYEIVRTLTTVQAWSLSRLRPIAAELVPASGPVILAPNHFSFMDHFFLGAALRRKVQFMAKSQMFTKPLQWVYTHGGVFPVQRGRRDDEAMVTAATILDRGGCMAMYCEGGRSRTGGLAEKAKPGIGRLALETGAVIVPVAIHGSARVRNWKKLEFPKVTVQYGQPFRYARTENADRSQQQAVADEIFSAIKTLYQGLESYGRSGVLARVRAERRLARRSGKHHAPAM